MPITTAVIGAAASVVTSTITNLLNEKVRRGQISLMEAQTQREYFKNRLDQLNSQQQYELALRLQSTQNATEQFKILEDTAAKIDVATVQGNASILSASVGTQSKNATTTAIIIGASLVALIAAAYFLTKNN